MGYTFRLIDRGREGGGERERGTVETPAHTHTHTHMHACTHTHTHMCAHASVVEFETENSHMPLLSVARSSVFDELLLNHLIQGGCVCTCACACMCMHVCMREGERGGGREGDATLL